MEGREWLLHGKVAMVTGAGSGVGRAAALRLAREGLALLLTGRRTQPVEETRELLGSGVAALVQSADVADPAAVDALVAAACARFGGVDILVNAAGLNVRARTLASVSVADYQQIIAADLNGAFYCA